jgi:hypothetical protein
MKGGTLRAAWVDRIGKLLTVAMLRAHRGTAVNVGVFTAQEPGRTEITCRAVGPIKTPDGETFETFIRKAFVDELTISELYVPTAPLVLTGHVDELDFRSFNEPAWLIALTLRSSNGRSLAVREEYAFAWNYMAEVACNQTAHALMPAVQNLVRKAVQHPGFADLLKPGVAQAPGAPARAPHCARPASAMWPASSCQ